jgi:pilus assembly protein Flp/PilA
MGGWLHSVTLIHASQIDGTQPMVTQVKQFAWDESGATAIEYALIAVLVSIAIITAVTALGSSLGSIFDTVASTVEAVSS